MQQQREAARRRFRRQKNANLLAKPGHHAFAIVLDHLKPAFNIGKIFRSADAFGAREVHLVGIDFFDPSPSMGSFKWVPARFFDAFSDSHENLSSRGYVLYALDPAGNLPLPDIRLPRKSAFIFGHEEYGHSFDRSAYPGVTPVTIPQLGKVESLNVSVAASIVMYEYWRQHRDPRAAPRRPCYRHRDVRSTHRPEAPHSDEARHGNAPD
jgi:tRNA G18 (ribose-2'-O)-methylase SpoU